MSAMKKILIAAAAMTAALTGTASAAPYGYGGPVNRQQANIELRIDQGLRNGSLTYREAARLRAELRQIDYLEARYRRGGLSGWERADLDRRLDHLSTQVRYQRHDFDRRGGWRS
jgi:hypothetical protein